MEELQLSLTPARVDQRNFGVMLANWRVGQVLNALVVNSLPTGRMLLSVGGKQFVTTTDIPVQPGTQLRLEVKQLDPELVLKQVAAQPPTQAPAQEMAAGRTVAATSTASSTGLSALLSQLSALAGKSESAEISAVARDLLGRAVKAERLSPSSVRQAVQQSGVFAEANLAAGRMQQAQHSPKASLSALQQIALAMAEDADAEGPDFLPLLLLSERSTAALSGIVNQQLASLPAEDGPPRWVVTIPIELAGQYHDVRLNIEKENGEPEEEGDTWRVSVHLDLPKMGGIDVTVMLREGRVNVGFVCEESSTSRLLGRSLSSLSQRLELQELKVDRLETEVTTPGPGDGPTAPGSGIEVLA